MAGMKRFVTYIYAYEEEKKGSNVGFARIEIRGQDARIEIHLRGVYAASAACRVYLFQREASGGKEATGVTGVLVGEMKLEKREDGYYISYYLDRGKVSGESNVKQDQPEKIAPARTQISYTTDSGNTKNMQEGDSIVITYDRATGAFLPLQGETWTQNKILSELKAGNDIPLTRNGAYCTQITVQGGRRYKTIQLIRETGKYTMTSGWN